MFEQMIYSLKEWGFIDIVLPFLLIFTIVFAVLEKTKVLGESGKVKKYASLIALVIALSVVVPHVTGDYYYGVDIVDIINNALPQVALLIVSIVVMMLTIGLWTGKSVSGKNGAGPFFIFVSLIIIVGIFLASIGWDNMPDWIYSILQSDLLAPIVAILTMGIILKFIISSDDGDNTGKTGSGMKNFFKNFDLSDDKDN